MDNSIASGLMIMLLFLAGAMMLLGVAGDGYTNLLYVEDETQLMTRTRGDWGTFRFPIEFYGNEHKIDFFVLQRGRGVLFGYGDEVTRAGHFYFVKCTV